MHYISKKSAYFQEIGLFSVIVQDFHFKHLGSVGQDKNKINHWKHRLGQKRIDTKFLFLKDLPDLLPKHLQMLHNTYSGLLYFYIDFQIQFDNDIFLGDRLAHDSVFYNIFFL